MNHWIRTVFAAVRFWWNTQQCDTCTARIPIPCCMCEPHTCRDCNPSLYEETK